MEMIKLEIDFMTGKYYTLTNKDIKIAIISPKGKILLADISNDGQKIHNFYKLNQYLESAQCEYHIDYLVILLNRFFKSNPNYYNFLTTKESNDVYQIFNQLLLDGYIIFFNNTCYKSISYQLNGTCGELLINNSLLTSDQIISIKKLEYYLKSIKTLTINKFLNYPNNHTDIYTTTKGEILKTMERADRNKKLVKNRN